MQYFANYGLALASVLAMSIAACSGTPSPGEPEDFLHKVAQAATERVVDSRLMALDSLALSAYDVFNPQRIVVDEDWIFVNDVKKGLVLAVAREDYERYRFIGHGPGEGPGETSGFRGFDVHDDVLVLANRPGRLARFSIEGAFVGEQVIAQHARRLEAVEDGAVMVMDALNAEYLWTAIGVGGTEVEGAGMVPNPAREERMGWSLRAEGAIDYHEGYIYFAGYAESLIKKYSLDGRLQFSVSTIDNHSSEHSYRERESGSMRIAGYTDTALFSARNIRAYGRYCLIRPLSDAEGNALRYLDVYDTTAGKYVRSYPVSRPPSDYALHDAHLFMLEMDDNPESGERDWYVKIYDNVLRN